ncbi:MAG: FAD-dependent oxidoreductase [Thermosulfidibacteraceae bacterium]|jgi:NADPH-dependent 2,4-dienoyl-CoA reductase/sulfur reductase-like enzyme
MRLAVVGGIAGGTSAAAKAKRVKKDAEIAIFEASNFVSVGACGMPYRLSGDIHDPMELVVRRKEDFEKTGIKVYLGYRVVEVDINRGVLFALGPKGEEEKYEFDKLILATGATARKLGVPGEDLRGIFTLKSLEDLLAIESFMAENEVRDILVVGSGFIGLEVIDAFVKRGFNVTSVDIATSVPPNFDEDVVEKVPAVLDSHGVKRIWGVSVTEFLGNGRVMGCKLSNGEEVKVDIVICSVGFKPTVDLAVKMGLELSVAGSIKVNEYMETSREGVYAAGDCTHSYSAVTGEPIYLPLGSLANRHGRVAGTNAVSGNRVVMPKIAGSSVFKLFNLGFARTGFVEKELKARNIQYEKVLIKAKDKAHYYPTSGEIIVKLMWEKDSGRVLGGEIVGPIEAVKRIDVVGAVICMGGTVEDLARIDMAYSPPFSPVWDPLTVAANQALKD